MTYFPVSVQPRGSIVANTTLHFSTNTPDGTPADAASNITFGKPSDLDGKNNKSELEKIASISLWFNIP